MVKAELILIATALYVPFSKDLATVSDRNLGMGSDDETVDASRQAQR